MKQFSEVIKQTSNQYVSLDGLNENEINKLSNLDGYVINECCCCCNTCCDKACAETPQSFIYFYSENEIVNKLKSDVKVQDLWHLHEQFGNRFRFKSESPEQVLEPLYFGQNTFNEIKPAISNTSNVTELSAGSQYCPKLYALIKELCAKFKFLYPTVLIKDNGVQLFFIKGGGTNGKEGTIKSSLVEVVQVLNKLENYEEITWAQVLDVSIDNLDDIYNFVITCEIKK